MILTWFWGLVLVLLLGSGQITFSFTHAHADALLKQRLLGGTGLCAKGFNAQGAEGSIAWDDSDHLLGGRAGSCCAGSGKSPGLSCWLAHVTLVNVQRAQRGSVREIGRRVFGGVPEAKYKNVWKTSLTLFHYYLNQADFPTRQCKKISRDKQYLNT